MLMLESMDFEKRLIDLETKISYQDKTIEDLHEMIYKQQQQIAQMEKAIDNFQRQMKSGDSEIRPNEKPPHY
jgi:SlyX protein